MNSRVLDPAEIDAFGAELDELHRRVTRDLGERDARYIRRVVRLQRTLGVAGRALLFAGAFPPAWIAGVALLSAAKIVENMEVGHNVMHGQYDWMNDPAFSSATYEWDNVCPADQWRHSHNFVHHTFTNVLGKDHDVGYRFLRVTGAQPWTPKYLLQPLWALLLALAFEWGVAVHDVDLQEWLRRPPRDRSPEDTAKLRAVAAKAGRQVLKDYLLFPLLAGPYAGYVLAGNLVANLVRNLWAFAVIFCGHFPDGTETFEAGDAPAIGESRGAWYLRQVRGSANFDGGRLLHFASGHLSHQIEHHLFPEVPAHRYPEMALEVRAICARYGVAYNTGSFARQLATVARRIVRLAVRPALVEA